MHMLKQANTLSAIKYTAVMLKILKSYLTLANSFYTD